MGVHSFSLNPLRQDTELIGSQIFTHSLIHTASALTTLPLRSAAEYACFTSSENINAVADNAPPAAAYFRLFLDLFRPFVSDSRPCPRPSSRFPPNPPRETDAKFARGVREGIRTACCCRCWRHRRQVQSCWEKATFPCVC